MVVAVRRQQLTFQLDLSFERVGPFDNRFMGLDRPHTELMLESIRCQREVSKPGHSLDLEVYVVAQDFRVVGTATHLKLRTLQ